MLNRHNVALSNDALRAIAPSIFAAQPWSEVSDRYRFIPTVDVLDKMRAEGFVPVAARQGRTRIPGKADFTLHEIRLRRAQDMENLSKVGDQAFELLLRNSHDRTSGYTVEAGIFRLVCSNGLVVCSGNIDSVKARHSGSGDLVRDVIDASFKVVEEAPAIMAQIQDWSGVRLSPEEQHAFATAAAELRTSTLSVTADQLLVGRRYADNSSADGKRDLWRTMNVVQENLLRGGIHAHDANARIRRTRAVKSIPEDTRINKALWVLSEQMRKLAA